MALRRRRPGDAGSVALPAELNPAEFGLLT
jgi:hypothetical protein